MTKEIKRKHQMLLDETFFQILAFASLSNQTTIHNFHTHFHDTHIVVLAAVQKALSFV